MKQIARLAVILFAITTSGCGKPWSISAKNTTDKPCEVFVAIGNESGEDATTITLQPRANLVMMTGTTRMPVKTIKVRRGIEPAKTFEQENTVLDPGDRFTVSVLYNDEIATDIEK